MHKILLYNLVARIQEFGCFVVDRLNLLMVHSLSIVSIPTCVK